MALFLNLILVQIIPQKSQNLNFLQKNVSLNFVEEFYFFIQL